MFRTSRVTCVQLDLNLLRSLDALLEEGSVAGAADRLHLSPPAMSRTLGRIRRATGDQILVRTGRTMSPTPYALSVREQVHRLVQQAEAVLTPAEEIDLTSLKRTFTLQCHDAVTTASGQSLLASVRKTAPGISLRLLPEASTDTSDLRQGRVDIVVDSTEPTLPDIRWEAIGEDRLVVVLSPDHPAARGELTAERLAQAYHIIVSRRGRLHDPLDDALARVGLERRVVAAAPTSTAALHLVRRSDLVVAAPERVCRPMVEALGLRTRPMPVELPAVPIILAWHQRYDNDRAHRWLRGQVRSALDDLLGTPLLPS
jgi:DNA-binding transcriptional LysR family regulator